jgi:hypothetical protein
MAKTTVISSHLAERLKAQGIYVGPKNRTLYRDAPTKSGNTKRKYAPAVGDERLPVAVVLQVLRDPRERTHLSAWARAAGMHVGTLWGEVFGPELREGHKRALSRVLCKLARGEIWLLRSHKGREGGERFDFYPVEEARRLLKHQSAVARSSRYGTLGFGFQA